MSQVERLRAVVLRRLSADAVWFGVLPALVAAAYWMFFRSSAVSAVGVRLLALPKLMFDQTMYMHVLAKDLLQGFHILPGVFRPIPFFLRWLWPGLTLVETYAALVIISAIASLWLTAFLFRRIGGLAAGSARARALVVFLMAQVVLILRPGGPSWYVPFAYGAWLCLFLGTEAWSRGRRFRSLAWWAAMLALASVYPWYLATLAAILGVIALFHLATPRRVIPALVIGVMLAFIAILFRDAYVPKILSSYAILLAVYGGIGFSHLPVLSNTMVLLALWILATGIVCRSAFRVLRPALPAGVPRSELRVPLLPLAYPARRATALVLTASWFALGILWFQGFFTGLSLVPDHFIYPIWLLSGLSWGMFPSLKSLVSESERHLFRWIGWMAAAFTLYILAKFAIGVYPFTGFPSTIIHIAAWTFLALTAFEASGARRMPWLASALALLFFAVNLFGVRVWIGEHVSADKELAGVFAWMERDKPSQNIHWCSDIRAADFLFANTGQTFHPAVSEKHDPVSIGVLQNRLTEVGAFFDPNSAGELWLWDDLILHDLDFQCRAFEPARKILALFHLPSPLERFISGCDEAWANAERARVIARIEERFREPVPQDLPLCERLVIRKSLTEYWRIPSSYRKLYADDGASVYGRP